MGPRSAFLLQILERLGLPLMAAIAEVSGREGGSDDDAVQKEAEQMAALLSQSVKVSVDLAASMDMKDVGTQADAVRLALAALAAPLVASQYRLTGTVSSDKDVKKLVTALEAVLTFADHFSPEAENTARLENIEAGAVPADESQRNIQFVSALVPVVNAVAAFSFGQAEKKLIQDIAGRLTEQAASMRGRLQGGLTGAAVLQAELKLLGALAVLYAACHNAEVARLMAMDEKDRAQADQGTDKVWEAFGVRVAMIEALGASATSGGEAVQSEAPAPEESKEEPKDVSKEGPQEEVQEEKPQGDPANPMSFFKPGVKKQQEGEA